MKWIVLETSVEDTASEFGPFSSMNEALKFAATHQMPWSHDFLRSVQVRKVADSHEIRGEVYKVSA